MNLKINVNVNNLTPDCITDKTTHIVARIVDDELWYWGAYESKERANTARSELTNAVVLEVAR